MNKTLIIFFLTFISLANLINAQDLKFAKKRQKGKFGLMK